MPERHDWDDTHVSIVVECQFNQNYQTLHKVVALIQGTFRSSLPRITLSPAGQVTNPFRQKFEDAFQRLGSELYPDTTVSLYGSIGPSRGILKASRNTLRFENGSAERHVYPVQPCDTQEPCRIRQHHNPDRAQTIEAWLSIQCHLRRYVSPGHCQEQCLRKYNQVKRAWGSRHL